MSMALSVRPNDKAAIQRRQAHNSNFASSVNEQNWVNGKLTPRDCWSVAEPVTMTTPSQSQSTDIAASRYQPMVRIAVVCISVDFECCASIVNVCLRDPL